MINRDELLNHCWVHGKYEDLNRAAFSGTVGIGIVVHLLATLTRLRGGVRLGCSGAGR
jgi:hypothetical protein